MKSSVKLRSMGKPVRNILVFDYLYSTFILLLSNLIQLFLDLFHMHLLYRVILE